MLIVLSILLIISVLIIVGFAVELFSSEGHRERVDRWERENNVSDDRLDGWDEHVDPSQLDRITRRALKKAGRLS